MSKELTQEQDQALTLIQTLINACGADFEDENLALEIIALTFKEYLKPQLGKYCKAFFYYWYNQNGTNTEQGFEQWTQTQEFKNLLDLI